MEVIPSAIEREGPATIVIEWSDGARQRFSAGRLRASCPCATCRERKSAAPKPGAATSLPVISMAETRPLAIESMRPVGNYAYNIAFSDGHDSGIFTFDLLRGLGDTLETGEG